MTSTPPPQPDLITSPLPKIKHMPGTIIFVYVFIVLHHRAFQQYSVIRHYDMYVIYVQDSL